MSCPTTCSSCDGTGEITEKLQQETREKYRPKFANLTPTGKITIPLLVLNVVIFLALEARPDLYPYLILWRGTLDSGYYWTFITASFLHAGFFHLLFNMSFLYHYGPMVEGLSGKARYLGVYLFTALTANSVSYLGHNFVEEGLSYGVGASGPLFGLIGYLFGVYQRWKIPQAAEGPRLLNWALILLAIGFGLDLAGLGFIDNWAHLGGGLGGLLLAYLLPRPKGH